MLLVANTLAISLYLLAAALQAGYLLNLCKAPGKGWLLALGTIAVLAHAGSVLHTIYFNHHLDLGLYRASSLIFWCISAISLLNILRRPVNSLIIAIFPMAALSVLVSSLSSPSVELHTRMSAGLLSHILSSILAYSLISIATIQAIALALQERHLKHHHLGGALKALPPLQTMEQILFELLWIGMALLTFSLISGFIFIDDIFGQRLVHKTFFSILAWLTFAILLWGRHQLGWRSQTAARWTIGGFFALMLAYFGSKFVVELLISA
jgi:ABC-type uncharacterized transport system permease subunit